MPDDFFHDTAAWWHKLAVGDLLLFKFPIFDPVDRSKTRPRPCVVSDLTLNYGVQFVELVPGFDQLPAQLTESDIITTCSSLIHAAQDGYPVLHFPANKAARFDIGHPGFGTDPNGGSPLIGRLPSGALAHLELLRERREASRERHLAEKRERREAAHERRRAEKRDRKSRRR
mgnify:CR=1 FL=1